jgi:FtsP/CotA-like multicopper oxidase with cupredoxin domain
MNPRKNHLKWALTGAMAVSLGAAPCLSAQSADTGAEWVAVDHAAKQVTLQIGAGTSEENIRWNFNGYYKGAGTLRIPAGYRVVIEFTNADPMVRHSVGLTELLDPFPMMFTDPEPVFAGAVSSNPTNPAEGTPPGEGETIEFTADRKGTYALACMMPAHAMTGMWLRVEVVASDEVGFEPTDQD